jgi:hypothetical protein
MILEIVRVEGLRGEAERRAVLSALEPLVGPGRVAVNLADHSVRIERPEGVGLSRLLAALNRAGFARVAALA